MGTCPSSSLSSSSLFITGRWMFEGESWARSLLQMCEWISRSIMLKSFSYLKIPSLLSMNLWECPTNRKWNLLWEGGTDWVQCAQQLPQVSHYRHPLSFRLFLFLPQFTHCRNVKHCKKSFFRISESFFPSPGLQTVSSIPPKEVLPVSVTRPGEQMFFFRILVSFWRVEVYDIDTFFLNIHLKIP